ncbi:E3 ubiquitin-protein ligase BRE1-like 2 [Zea mays]|uniref:E3 ubiquitin-protein ligase BRE1-like 2 n=1 Tax=Zea mays TaxID=4577 RepID=A0A1D6K5K8_MAIZE|nr:E3 ubiquitin-protein ligase BRE1-like 2 [Zea mays]
MWKYIINNFL